MKTTSKIFILVLILLGFLASLAWVGVRHLANILREFEHVAQVDLVLMETATSLNNLQLEKEIVFSKLTAASEELAFGQVNPARQEYLVDYVKGLGGKFDELSQLTDQQLKKIDRFAGVPEDLRNSFEKLQIQTEGYDRTVRAIFKAVDNGGFQLSLEDLNRTDQNQKVLMDNVSNIVHQVWGLVHQSMDRTRHWHQQSKLIFFFSLLLTVTLGLLLWAFKKNLDETNRQKKDLEKLNQELDRFVHTVSHDIAGPLTTIVGYAAYLEKHYSQLLDQQGRDCVSGVRKGAARLNLLITDMLALTKISRVQNPYSKEPIQDVAEIALANCDFMIKEFHADIAFLKPLPQIVCDRIKMTAIFSNLLNNAIKFTRPGVAPQIKIGWNETPKSYEFYVQDNGIGIDRAHHQEIFEIFKRLHKFEEYAGSGVGLAIVKAAVEDHGGQVRLESALGQGAKFIFTIPKNLTAAKPLY